MHSLHYVKETYEILVLDEIETILSKWDGDFMQLHKLPNWQNFVRLIKSAKRVIVLDAFTTKRTLELLKRIEDAPMVLFQLTEIQSNRKVVYVKHFEQMLNKMVQALKDGKKLFIYYPWKKSQRKLLSMASLLEYIQNATGKRGVFYNSEVDDEIKMQLGSVNSAWVYVDFVLTNNIMTCGVSYDNKRHPFDEEYLFVAGFSNPRDIVQVSFRPRYTTTGIMNICFYGPPPQNEARHDDTQMMGEIYASLFKNTSIELDSPLKETLRFFFNKANFKQVVDPEIISDELKKEVRDAMGEYGSTHSYIGLADISNSEFDEINQKIVQRKATQTEKLCHQKHLFKQKFSTLGEWVEFGWDQQLITCTDKIREIKFKPTSIFNRIARENNFVGFPERLDKLTLSDELRTEIFRKFKFKTLTSKSTVSAICKNIYNTNFGNIYSSEKVSSTQNRTVLNAWMSEYFTFVYENIKKRVVESALCKCESSVLTNFCGHLLCGTCNSWAMKRDEEGPEEFRDPDAEYLVAPLQALLQANKPETLPAPLLAPSLALLQANKTETPQALFPAPKFYTSVPKLYGYKITAESKRAKI